jgi:exopolysaccharide production protein ExoQ
MPPSLALFLTIAFVGWLFWRDSREKADVTGALWLPFLWMLVPCTRGVSDWLRVFGLPALGGSSEDGSPLDASVYFVLIAAGIYVLNARRFRLSEFVQDNRWFIAFVLYCFLAVFWSDFPFIAFKRWIKYLGHPIMVLVIFTEPDPEQALKTLMKRIAYVIVPISIVLIKYYPEIGRTTSPWATSSMSRGIARDKNGLGADCFILGFFFFWYLLQVWRTEKGKARRNELLLTIGFLVMICWLIKIAHSATSTFSLLIAIAVMVVLGRNWVNKRLIGTYAALAIITLVVAELAFGIFGRIAASSGHNATYIGRSELWQRLLPFSGNPIIGTGFDSFWMGERLAKIGELYWWSANEAHNGYLETYLNLGLIGLVMIIGWIIVAFQKSRWEFLRNFEFGRFRLAFLVAVVLYNWAESGFRRLHPTFFVFYLIALDYRTPQLAAAEPFVDDLESRKSREQVYVEVP